ncbi:MAG: hypothetical protein PHC34_05515 [Candidatus Gastranaerophilales bacterium]|nr:hypothetical protein [Candidatus Gastranaerophilales bacterium]
MQSLFTGLNQTKYSNYLPQQRQNKNINTNLNYTARPIQDYSNINFTGKFAPSAIDSFAEQVFVELGKMSRQQQDHLHYTLQNLNPKRACSKRILDNLDEEQKIRLPQLLKVPFKMMNKEQRTEFVDIVHSSLAKKEPAQHKKLIRLLPDYIADILPVKI